MRVLVTGANGFLGRHVVDALLRRGHAVRAMVRPATRIDGLGWDGRVDVVRADLRSTLDLAPAFDGIEALIHLAAAVGGDDDLQFQSTVVGTERLMDAMARTRTKRIVLASSFSVYDWSAIRGRLTEDSPIEADLYNRDGYAIAKVWQERVVRAAAARHGWALTVLRPGFIWGKGGDALAGVGMRVGRALVVIGPLRRLPLTHVENCADAFAAALESDAPIGGVFNVVDDAGGRAWTFGGRLMSHSGRAGFRVPVPYWFGMGVARAARLVSRAVFRGKGKLPSILTPCKFEARFKPLSFDNTRLTRTLHWAPPLDHGARLRATCGDRAPAGEAGPAAIATMPHAAQV